MEQIFNIDQFYIYYYQDVISEIHSLIDSKLATIPNESYKTFHNFSQFLNKLVDPISLLKESFRITTDVLKQEFIDCVWHDIGNKTFDTVLSYIFHIDYQERTQFHVLYKQLIKTYSIPTIVAARCVHDCILHYLKDRFKTLTNTTSDIFDI